MTRGYHAQIVADGNSIEDKVCEILGLKAGPTKGDYQPDIWDVDNGVIGEIKGFKAKRTFREKGGKKERSHKEEISFRTRQLAKYTTLVDHLNRQQAADMGLYYFFARYAGEKKEDKTITDIYILDTDVLRGLIYTRDEKRSKFGLKDRDFDRVSHIENKKQKLLTNAKRAILRRKIIAKNDKTAFMILSPDSLDYVCSRHTSTLYDAQKVNIHYTYGCRPIVTRLLGEKNKRFSF